MKIVSKTISSLRSLYEKHPRLYPLVEVSVVLASYFLSLFVFSLWYRGVHFIGTLTAVAALLLVSSFFVHGDRLKDLGIRLDNILISLKECAVAACIFAIPILILLIIYLDDYVPHRPLSLLKYFIQYLGSGLVQQFFLLDFVFLRLSRAFKSKSAAIVTSGIIFSLMHATNVPLMVVTLFAGLTTTILFSRNRNLFTLSFMHAVMAMVVYITLAPGLISQTLHIGPPGTEKYSIYGDGARIASGDLDGDGVDEIIVGRGPNGNNDTELFIFNGEGKELRRLHPYDRGVRFGVNLAAGDVDGDGVDEIIVGKGPAHENNTLIVILDLNGNEVGRFTAFDGKRFGVNVASGDIDGDGRDEIIAAPGPGQGYWPTVKVFDSKGELLHEYKVNGTIMYDGGYSLILRHGLELGAGDVDGDGIGEIVAGSAHIRGYRTFLTVLDFESESSTVQHEWFLPYTLGVRCGVNIASGDIDGDGTDEIITGPGPYRYSDSHLKVFNSRWETIFEALPFKYKYGLNVASGDLDGDGVCEIIVTPGPGENYPSSVKVLSLQGEIRLEFQPF